MLGYNYFKMSHYVWCGNLDNSISTSVTQRWVHTLSVHTLKPAYVKIK